MYDGLIIRYKNIRNKREYLKFMRLYKSKY